MAEYPTLSLDYMVQAAKELATDAHKGQHRMGGEPFITHPAAVATAVSKYGLIWETIAWLHDVVEDTDITLEDLRRRGFPIWIVEAVDSLTHRDGEAYYDYVMRVRTNPMAVTVKLADLAHNLSTSTDEQMKNKRTIWRMAQWILSH